MASLFEKILKSVNSGVSIEEALAKHGTNQEVTDELLNASGATSGQVWTSDGTNGSWATPTAVPTGLSDLTVDASVVTSGTAQATTSGTAFDFTSIPSWAKNIALVMEGVSLSGTDHLLVQIGDSGGIETTGYISSSGVAVSTSVAVTSSTAGFIIYTGSAARIFSGVMDIALLDSNLWVANHSGKFLTTAIATGGGDKTLSGTLDRVRLTRTGTDTFDAGSVNIMYW